MAAAKAWGFYYCASVIVDMNKTVFQNKYNQPQNRFKADFIQVGILRTNLYFVHLSVLNRYFCYDF